MKMTMGALCVAVLFTSFAVGNLALTVQPARKLLQGSPMMMDMSASPMMMGMSTSPMMMSPMSPMMPMAPMMMPMAPSMAPAMPMMYMLSLTPQAEVPGTANCGSTAMCNMTFMPDSIKYSLSVMNIYAVTAAHIHAGAPGMNGPVVAFLYKNPNMMPSNMTATNGMLASGMLMSDSFVGPAKNMTVMAFYSKYIATDMAYVNVHTTAHPDGEIRANITPATMIKSA